MHSTFPKSVSNNAQSALSVSNPIRSCEDGVELDSATVGCGWLLGESKIFLTSDYRVNVG